MSDNITQLGTTTPRLNLNLPDVGGDWDQWGDDTNANWQFIDANLLPIYGGAMTGTLLLNADPIQPLAASTKQYVDALRALYLPMAGGALEGQLVTAASGGGANVSLGIGGTTNGLWSSSTALVLQAGGATNTTFGAAGNLMNVPLQVPGGSFAAPGLGLGAANTGIYSPSSSNVGIACSGVSVFATSSITARFLIPLQLAADPTTGLGAATKQYVDGLVGGAGVTSFNGRNGAITLTAADVATASALTIPGDGTLQIGTSNAQMPGPLTVGGQGINFLAMGAIGANMAIGYQANQVFVFANGAATQPIAMQSWVTAGFLGLGGGTLTGPLNQAADPATPLGTATKQYVDAAGAAASAIANRGTGRNLIHNPLINIQTRGAGPFAASGLYAADGWLLLLNTDAASVFPQAAGDAARAQAGDEAMTNMLRNNFTGNAAAGAFNLVCQRIEGVRRLAGKTVTVSFYAQGSAALNVGVNLNQVFGTGGSPAAPVTGVGQSVLTSTVWQRYSLQFAVPSSAGHALGNNNDDYTQLGIWFSSGATNAAAAGNVGVQSGTMSLWGIQLEIGAGASALDKPDPADDLARCQRTLTFLPSVFSSGYSGAANQPVFGSFTLPVQMRAAPTGIITGTSFSNAAGYILNSQSNLSIVMQTTALAAGEAWATGQVLLSAEL